jgi:hypothetical protein
MNLQTTTKTIQSLGAARDSARLSRARRGLERHPRAPAFPGTPARFRLLPVEKLEFDILPAFLREIGIMNLTNCGFKLAPQIL